MPRRTKGSLERAVQAVLSAHQEAMTTAQVRDALGGDLAYTTVLTVLTRLFDKGDIVREPVGRGYAYSAPYAPADLTARRMASLLGERDDDRAAVLTSFVDRLGPGDEHLLRSLLDR